MPNDHITKDQLQDIKFVEMIPHLYSVTERVLTTRCDDDVCWDAVKRGCDTNICSGHVDVGFRFCEKQLKILEPIGVYVHNECLLKRIKESLRSKDVLYMNGNLTYL